MIDADTFRAGFNRLSRRFPHGVPQDEPARVQMAAEYHEYLSPLLDDEGYQRAVMALWATREFFPRPADFLLVSEPSEWARVQACIDAARDHQPWGDGWKALPERTRRAALALGGVLEMKDATDTRRLRERFEKEFERACATEALALDPPALPAGARSRQLGRGNP